MLAAEPAGIYGLGSGSPHPQLPGALLGSPGALAECWGPRPGRTKRQQQQEGEWQSKHWSDALAFVQRPSLLEQRLPFGKHKTHCAWCPRAASRRHDPGRVGSTSPVFGRELVCICELLPCEGRGTDYTKPPFTGTEAQCSHLPTDGVSSGVTCRGRPWSSAPGAPGRGIAFPKKLPLSVGQQSRNPAFEG